MQRLKDRDISHGAQKNSRLGMSFGVVSKNTRGKSD
jgi:hypothetical protein